MRGRSLLHHARAVVTPRFVTIRRSHENLEFSTILSPQSHVLWTGRNFRALRTGYERNICLCIQIMKWCSGCRRCRFYYFYRFVCVKKKKRNKNNKFKRVYCAEQMFLSPFDFSTVISLSIRPVRIARLILLQPRSSIVSSDHRRRLPGSDFISVDEPVTQITT